jgi:hypothetical protein
LRWRIKARHRVASKRRILSQHHHPFDHRLRDQDSIERVSVMRRQLTGRRRMVVVDVERVEPASSAEVSEPIG